MAGAIAAACCWLFTAGAHAGNVASFDDIVYTLDIELVCTGAHGRFFERDGRRISAAISGRMQEDHSICGVLQVSGRGRVEAVPGFGGVAGNAGFRHRGKLRERRRAFGRRHGDGALRRWHQAA